MIEDKELRDLFRTECEEHLQCLDDGLLAIENRLDDKELLENMFRAAHSVKGAARMLGLTQIQSLAHVLEDALGAIRNGEKPDKSQIDDLYPKLVALRQWVEQAVGEPIAGSLPAELLDHVKEKLAETNIGSIVKTTLPDHPAYVASIPQIVGSSSMVTDEFVEPQQSITANHNVSDDVSSAFRIATLRVDPKRLDVLLTHAGELAVTNQHVSLRMQKLDAIIDQFESCGRVFKNLGLSQDIENVLMQSHAQMQTMLARLRVGISEDSRRLDFVSEQLGQGIRSMRLLPFSTLFNQFPRLVHELANSLQKEAELVLEGAEVVVDKRILEELKDPLVHLLRNAVHHGLESPAQRESINKSRIGKITLRASQGGDHVNLDIEDDGRGLDAAEIKRSALSQGLYGQEQLAMMSETQLYGLILQPGFTTARLITEISGRGVGLDVVRTNVEKLKGSIQIFSQPGQGLSLRLQLPLTLATMRVQIVSVQGRSFALPLEYIQFSRRILQHDLFTLEGRQTFALNGQPLSIIPLGRLLELPAASVASDQLKVTFLKVENELFGLIIDELLDETEVMLKPQSQLLKRVRNVSAATILVSGEVCPVLNPSDLLKSLRKLTVFATSVKEHVHVISTETKAKKTLLLVEDSITTRTQEKRILESAGYNVITAVDGLDGYNKFQSHKIDGVVSDIDMPNMNGLALTEAIRKDKQHADIPIILVTSLSSEDDQRRGLEAGADAYLIKSAFDQNVLLDCLARLL